MLTFYTFMFVDFNVHT